MDHCMGAPGQTHGAVRWELRDAAGRTVHSGREPGMGDKARILVPSAGLAAGQYVWHASGTEVSVRLQLH